MIALMVWNILLHLCLERIFFTINNLLFSDTKIYHACQIYNSGWSIQDHLWIYHKKKQSETSKTWNRSRLTGITLSMTIPNKNREITNLQRTLNFWHNLTHVDLNIFFFRKHVCINRLMHVFKYMPCLLMFLFI